MPDQIVVSQTALLTPLGEGLRENWEQLLAGNSGINPCQRFPVGNFSASQAACLPLSRCGERSLIWDLLQPLQTQLLDWQADYLVLATAKGEIDLLEQAVRKQETPQDLTPADFLRKMLAVLQIRQGVLVSGACASSNLAIARGAELLLAGRAERVLVLGIDIVSAFVFSGFAALQALSADKARPFARDRDGLSVGEGCGNSNGSSFTHRV